MDPLRPKIVCLILLGAGRRFNGFGFRGFGVQGLGLRIRGHHLRSSVSEASALSLRGF